jgi:hypothetical protein
MRSFALGNEKALLMASYPKDRPTKPFPYWSEVMTGFEYTAAVGMLQEGMTKEGLTCIRNVRDRYNGLKRSPFDEAECGHHYARAMAAWAAVLALTGFHYSAVRQEMVLSVPEGKHFFSTGYAFGTCTVTQEGQGTRIELTVREGALPLHAIKINDVRLVRGEKPPMRAGETWKASA